MTRAIIVGSGMAGLTAAAYLARHGCEVEIFEQADEIGGVTWTLHRDGFSWDLGPLMVEAPTLESLMSFARELFV